ncbi:hypothetical protein QYF36_013796 [Acer negundo]|nr:hypothetical protein QYF36_013796 [Acer negundo]
MKRNDRGWRRLQTARRGLRGHRQTTQAHRRSKFSSGLGRKARTRCRPETRFHFGFFVLLLVYAFGLGFWIGDDGCG